MAIAVRIVRADIIDPFDDRTDCTLQLARNRADLPGFVVWLQEPTLRGEIYLRAQGDFGRQTILPPHIVRFFALGLVASVSQYGQPLFLWHTH